MNYKYLHRIFALLSFAVAFITYSLTVQPSVPFWDCGEFSAASMWQQVPHPPGAPLFLMIGKLFQLLIPFGDYGWRFNMVSVVASAFTIFLLYLITVLVVRNFFKKENDDFASALAIYGSAFIAAAAFTFSDTFWFNAVESEVYAASTLFVAIVIYLVMKWNEEADKVGNEKYLMLIAYLIGLSTGVHLLSILTIFSIVFLVYFRKYQLSVKGFIITGIISVFAFFIIYNFIVQAIPAFLAGHTPGRNEAMEYSINNSTALKVFAIGIIAALIYGFYYSYKKDYHILKLVTSSILLILVGYTTYAHILIRANANPPMNENEPKTFSKLSSYIGREQYGQAPFWPRRYQREERFIYRYELRDEAGNYVYGKWYPPTVKPVTMSDGTTIGVPEFTQINTAGELAYLWKYQIYHMYIRYFYWNFVGRMSDVQDAGVAWFNYDKKEYEQLNYKSGYKNQFPVRFFALPLIFGLIGLYFHFAKDKKMAFVYLVMFLMMGVLAAIQQNQQDPQPRERDYFYAGSFMIFSMWIGMGAFALIEWISKEKMKITLAAPILIVSLLLVPINMAFGGWKIHSRAGNYLPFDYAYNILQSAEKDAIIFTNGDNDTFPVWYLQDVAGVRRDVRIVNLSLANTLWYVDQLKNREPWGAKKIPLSFPDDMIQNREETDEGALSYKFGEARQIEIPVRKEILAQYTDNQNVINSGKMSYTFVGTPRKSQDGKTTYIFKVQDLVINDIISQLKFERPVYFSTTVGGGEVFVGLDDFLRLEGMLWRVCPVRKIDMKTGDIEVDITEKCLLNYDNSNDYRKEPHFGFKFRNLNNSDVYYDEVHRRLMESYRIIFYQLADRFIERNEKERAKKLLDKMNELISPVQFPYVFESISRLVKTYEKIGDNETTKKYAKICLDDCLEIIEKEYLKPDYIRWEVLGRIYGPYKIAADMYEILEDINGAKAILSRFEKQVESFRNSMINMNYPQSEINYLDQNLADTKLRIDYMHINLLIKKNKLKEAYAEAQKLLETYRNNNSPIYQIAAQFLQGRIIELQTKLGIIQENNNTSVSVNNIKVQ